MRKTVLPLLVMLAGSAFAQQATPKPKSAMSWAAEGERKRLIAKIGAPPTTQELEAWLRSQTRDPESLVVEKWSDITVGKSGSDSFWKILVTYRANNGIGGVKRKAAEIQYYRGKPLLIPR